MRGEEGWLVLFVGLVGDDGSAMQPRARGVPIGLACWRSLCRADDGARLNVRSDVEQGFEVTPVEGFAAGQVEGDDVASEASDFARIFVVKPPRRAPKRLFFLALFAPAADT